MRYVKHVRSFALLNNTVEQLGQTFVLDPGGISHFRWMAGTEGEEITLLSPATHCWREAQAMKNKDVKY